MKIAGYSTPNGTMVGRVAADGAVMALAPMETFWLNPEAAAGRDGAIVGNLAELVQKPAIPLSARVICIGLNYRLHAQESNMPIPEIPVIFGRWARTLSSDGDPAPAVEEKFDWEGELGVVIGRRMFRVDRDQASAGIFGYAAFNDLTARTFQMQTPQWTIGKNSDASGPLSPVVTVDEVGDPTDGLRLTTTVNGKTVQDSTTADMIFPPAVLISHLSQVMTLSPGDLIVTGTPSGVGFATGDFLKPGDVVRVEIERIGSVTTPIVACGGAIS